MFFSTLADIYRNIIFFQILKGHRNIRGQLIDSIYVQYVVAVNMDSFTQHQ